MSFIFSQALVAASSVDKCSDTDAFVQLSGNPTHKLSLSPDKTTALSHLSRFGLMCKPLTESRGAELLTSWLAGFHAKTSALPEKAQALPASDQACGVTWRGSLAKFDPVSSSWKTVQLCLLEDSELSSVIWPRSGMTADGQCWELPMSERRTSGTGSGLLPNGETFFYTANTTGMNGGSNSRRAYQKRKFPTPCAMDAGSGRMNTSIGGKPRPMLALMARKNLWPTPTVCGNYNRKGASATSGDGLATVVRMWSTPTAQDAKNNGSASQMDRNSLPLNAQAGGALNPQWVAWLMGWPIEHTNLKPSATAKSLNAQPLPLTTSSANLSEAA